jgi:hypothetical protein
VCCLVFFDIAVCSYLLIPEATAVVKDQTDSHHTAGADMFLFCDRLLLLSSGGRRSPTPYRLAASSTAMRRALIWCPVPCQVRADRQQARGCRTTPPQEHNPSDVFQRTYVHENMNLRRLHYNVLCQCNSLCSWVCAYRETCCWNCSTLKMMFEYWLTCLRFDDPWNFLRR